MRAPRCRRDFERNINLLIEGIFQIGRSISPFKEHNRSILKIRFCPNSRTDFISIDDDTRLMANTESNFPG